MANYRSNAIREPAWINERGRQYEKEGRVKELSWDGESGCFLVEGSEAYKARLRFDGKKKLIAYHCSCPYDRGMCKHVVACLSYLDDVRGDEKPEENAASDGGSAILEDYLDTCRLENKAPLPYEYKPLMRGLHCNDEQIASLLSLALELSLPRGTMFADPLVLYHDLLIALKAEERKFAPAALKEALGRVNRLSPAPLYALFYQGNDAELSLVMEAIVAPCLGKLEILEANYDDPPSLFDGWEKRTIDAILPYLPSIVPGSSEPALEEASRRGLVEEANSIFSYIVAKERRYPLSGISFLRERLGREGFSSLSKEALAFARDFDEYLRTRKAVIDREIPFLWSKIAENAANRGFLRLVEAREGKPLSAPLSSFAASDLLKVYPYLEEESREFASKAVRARIAGLLEKEGGHGELAALARLSSRNGLSFFLEIARDPRLRKKRRESFSLDASIEMGHYLAGEAEKGKMTPYGGSSHVR